MSTPNQSTLDSDQASKGLILVVEDQNHLREDLQFVLTQAHFEVIAAESGQQALAALRACPRVPDLIITEDMMLHMNGVELMREIRKESAWMCVPLLFLAGRCCDRNVDIRKIFGGNDFLLKPFNADQLLRAVEEVLARSRASS